jgi:hypothetical protein
MAPIVRIDCRLTMQILHRRAIAIAMNIAMYRAAH